MTEAKARETREGIERAVAEMLHKIVLIDRNDDLYASARDLIAAHTAALREAGLAIVPVEALTEQFALAFLEGGDCFWSADAADYDLTPADAQAHAELFAKRAMTAMLTASQSPAPATEKSE